MRRICFLFVQITFIYMLVIFSPVISLASVINVPTDAPTIQAAVNAASDKDTIILAAGTYQENVDIVNKQLTIVGKEGPEKTFIDGGTGTAITIRGSGLAREIRGISFKNSKKGISSDNISVNIINCHFLDNEVGIGGFGDVSFNIFNSLFVRNKIGVQQTYYGNDSLIVNSTFAGNEKDVLFTPGYGTRSKLEAINTIFTGEIASGEYNYIYLNYCNYYPTKAGANVVIQTGNLTGDPLFVAADNGDYHLKSNSPCIDKGDPIAFYNNADGSRGDIGYMGGSGIFANLPSLKFGYVAGGAKKTLPIEIFNYRDADLTLVSFANSDSRLSSTSIFPMNISPSSKAVVNVNYRPTVGGNYNGWIRFYSNQIFGAAYAEIIVSGYGIIYSSGVINVPTDAPTIQAAVNVASDGDSILLAAGTYRENVDIVNKRLTIVGKEGPEKTFIDGGARTAMTIQGGGPARDVRGISFKNSPNGISLLSSSVNIINCHFLDNEVGILASFPGVSSSYNILNSLFVGNKIGVQQTYTGNDSLIVNSTFAGNEKDVLFTPGYGTRSKLEAINTIFTGEIASGEYNYIYLNYCNYYPTKVGANVVIQTGNLTGDPLFVDAVKGDYHLKSNSPCIDKGDPTYNYSQEPFPNGNRINMGRYGNTAEAEIIDTAGPTGTITVNGGAVRTATTAVTLTLVASDSGGLSQMQFSNDGTTWSVAEAYSATKSWTLPADDGQKTVYVKFKDNVGNWSAPTSTVITLGTAAPVSTATPRGGSFKNAQNVTLMATDAATIYYSKNGDNPTTTSASYATPIPITVDTTLKFFAKDSTGHSEVVKAERYIIDALAPMGGTISVNGGVATAARQTVTLTLSAADPSGVTQMQFSNDGINWSDPEPYSATKSWALSAGNGAKTVYVRFADTLGNWTTATIAATIDLQITARPQDPKGLAIGGVTTSSVALQWSLNPEANVVYNIFRSRMADGIFYRVNTAPADSGNYDYASKKMRFTDIVVKDGGSYFYKIQAVLNGVASSGFSDIMGATLPTIDDYTVNIIEPSTIAAVGGTAKYIILLLPRERFQGTLNLTCMKVPSGLTYAFVLNDRRTASLAGIALPATVTLEVTAGSIAVAKEHHFDLQVQNVWESGSSDPRTIPLTLTVVANNGAGIFADLDRTEFGKGEKVRIYGAIWPPPLAERTVTPTVTPASGGNPEQRTVKTSASGKFSETVWTPTLGVGTYDLEASWRDENANSWTSEARTFVVGRGEAVLTCLRDANVKPKQGDDFTIFGKLLPADVAALTYRVVDPDGQIKDYPFFTAEDGSYRETGNFFTKKGVWKFKVYWTGNDDWIGTESEWLSIPVEVELGRAIILGGGVAEQSNTYWDVTKKLIVETYRDFKSRGFTDDMIHLMINGQLDVNYDSKIDNVVDNGQPSVTAFLDAVRTRYAAAQNPELNADIPLYIYMQGHGTNDARFKVLGDDQYVNAAQLKGALDTLQKQTGCTVVLIIEACYSGTFIQGLASPEGYKRIILTSADNTPYSTDASGRNTFSRYLFAKLKEGDNFYKAFTFTRNILQNTGYPPPRLEDFSGGVLANAMLLKGDLTWGLRPVIAGIEATTVLERATMTPIAVNVTRGDVDVEKVWLQVIAPNAQIIGQEGTIAYPEVSLVKNAATGKYEATLRGLSIAGIYKIVVFAQDVDKEVSDPATAFITVASPPPPEGDVNGDGDVTLADAILALKVLGEIAPTVGTAGGDSADYVTSGADVNGDRKIGMAEVIFILQKAAGVR